MSISAVSGTGEREGGGAGPGVFRWVSLLGLTLLQVKCRVFLIQTKDLIG